MKVAGSLKEFERLRAACERPIGFVPTMGYLHEGHLSLARLARTDCRSVVASIFVNPTQFSPTEDLASYPRNLDRDVASLDAEGVDLVFAPSDPAEIYSDGYCTWVTVDGLAQRLEGASRPTHFRGVATVVAKLFNIVRPDRAYFGQKDAQQALVIRRMVLDLQYGIDLVLGPTVRESDGLAMSSRNAYLNPQERTAATVLRRCLMQVEQRWAEGERNGETLRRAMREILDAEPLARPDYVSVADIDSLEELGRIEDRALVSLAVRIGKTRLIDNIVLPIGDTLW